MWTVVLSFCTKMLVWQFCLFFISLHLCISLLNKILQNFLSYLEAYVSIRFEPVIVKGALILLRE